MSQVQKLRSFVSQRLNVALEEILEAFDRTIRKYEEEAALNREVISRQHALLCALNNPIMTNAPESDVFTNQVLLTKEDVSPTHQNLSQDRVPEQLQLEVKQGLDEGEIIEFTFNSKKPNNPCDIFQTEPKSMVPNQNGSIVSSTETEDSDDYSKAFADAKPTSDKPGGLCRPKDGLSCQSCKRTFTARRFLFRHVGAHAQDTKKICGLCGEQFVFADSLKLHLQTHSRTRKVQIEARTRSRETRLRQLSQLIQNKVTEGPDDSSKTPEKKKKKKTRGRPKKNKPNEEDPGGNKKRKRRI